MIICFPHPPGSGGPGSFQKRFERELQALGWKVIYKGAFEMPELIFVVGGTRRLLWLLLMKLKGVPIVYRLDGIGWLHRKKKVGLKKFLLSESQNWGSKFIHAFLADKIVYQSRFVEYWWNRKGWRKRKNISVIYNGIQMPKDENQKIVSGISARLVVMEGTIDYSPYAVRLLNDLAARLPAEISMELYGKFEFSNNLQQLDKRINYKGFLPPDQVTGVLTGSVYLSLDINPACPNTVIEAMSCGAPVVAFDTGSLKELVSENCGNIVPYGSDPWKLAYPETNSLIISIAKVMRNYAFYSVNARNLAKEKFSIEDMTSNYIEVINSLLKK